MKCHTQIFLLFSVDNNWWWFGVMVTSLGRSTKLLYARPG